METRVRTGANVIPDEVCKIGRIHFEKVILDLWNSLGYFKIPYIWLLALCITNRKNDFLTWYNYWTIGISKSKTSLQCPVVSPGLILKI